jgi:hypothetical protein
MIQFLSRLYAIFVTVQGFISTVLTTHTKRFPPPLDDMSCTWFLGRCPSSLRLELLEHEPKGPTLHLLQLSTA